MYTAVSLLVVPTGINKRWITITPTAHSVPELFALYRKVYIGVNILPDTTLRYLNLEQFAPRYSAFTGTLAQMLTDLGNTGAIEAPAPVLEVRTAKFSDAIRVGYHGQPVHPTLGLNASIDARTDLLLTRQKPATNYTYFYQHALVSVNGFYHMIDTDGVSGIHVKDGAKSLKISGQNQVGVYSFSAVSALKYVPITTSMLQKRLSPEMIAGTSPTDPFSTIGYVKINQTLTNKSVLAVIGGYLVPPDSGLVTRVSDNEFQIDFQNLPLLQRYYESSGYIDLSSLGLTSSGRNPSQISVEELLSDAVLMKYLTLSQSFFIVLDTPELFVNRLFVKKTGTPGMFISFIEPQYPLCVGNGRMPEYWPKKEEDRWSLSAFDNYNRQKLFDTTDPMRLRSVSAVTLPFDPEMSPGYGAFLMEIGRDLAL